jgi:3-phosphoinositide dependent protein kinase-1
MSTTSDYWVGPVIGQGSFAQVLYGKHKSTHKNVAIKVVEKIACTPAVLSGLWMERNLLQQFQSSQYVVNLWASFVDTQCVYLVLELADEGDLQGLIDYYGMEQDRNEHWKSSSIPCYVEQLVRAVQFLQSKRVIHCDLKPANVLCTSEGRLQLADFASAIQLDQNLAPPQSTITIPRGTSHYASPELLKSSQNDLTLAVDLWSLGCITYAMFQGRPPFWKESESLTVQAIMEYVQQQQQQQPSPTFLSPLEDYPKWKTIVGGLLQITPTARMEAWESLLVAEVNRHGASDSLFPNKNEKLLLLPKPAWKRQVEEASLKDGAAGWAVFLM